MKNPLISTLLALFIAVAFTGCLGEEKQEQQPQARPPVAVKTLKIEKQTLPIFYEYPATLQSSQQVDVVARVAGLLVAKHFTEGQMVHKGDLLYEIDAAKYHAALNMAKAKLGVEEANARAASLHWERAQALYQANATSKQAYDDALKSYEATKASVVAAKAALESARIDLEYTKIHAPSSGVASLSLLDVGSYISSPNTPLVTLTQVDPLYANFSLPDRDFIRHKKELESASVHVLLGQEKMPNSGKITFTDVVVNPLTSTVQMRATFENQEHFLTPGMFVRVRLEGLFVHDGIVIPQEALLQDASGSFVYLHKEGKAVKTAVVIDQPREGMFILSAGLQGNEELIIDNLTKIRPNAPVRISNP